MTDVAEILADPEVQASLKAARPEFKLAWAWRLSWFQAQHKHQVLPHGDWWSIWLMLAGRGAGKTRTAAEQIGWWAWENPGTRWLVAAPTSSDVRSTCFEGDSGLLTVIPSALIADYNKALHELKLINGSLIKGIPASEPERFRGPQFHGAWCITPDAMIALPGGGEKAIQFVRPGDVVMTRHGPRRVLAAGVSGNPSELVSMDCGDTSLTATADHPILVGDQWIPAGDIKPGDLVWATSTSAADTPTASSMSGTTGKSLLGGLFTTRTGTKPITIPAILRRCREAIISVITLRADPHQTRRQEPPPRRLSLFARQSLQSAFNVARALFLAPQERLGGSVQGHALSLGGSTSSFRNCGDALSAKANILPRSDSSGIAASSATTSPRSGPIALRQLAVRRVERLPNSVTYNLTVEGEHEFIANGIVVHNCDELAAWDYLQEAWDQIQFGVRLGTHTKIICTTTPKPKDLIVELVGREGDDVVLTTASTYANLANLSDNFRKQILQYEGTTLGRQEIYAEIIDPEEGGIVNRDMFRLWPAGREFPRFEYILQSYDVATSEKVKNDPTACITFGMFKPLDGPMSVMVIDCWQERMQYPDLRPKVIEEYETIFGEGKDRKRVDLLLIEDKSAGISLIQDLQRAHLPVRAYNPGNADKMQRLNIVSNIIARGRVWIPESDARKGYVKDWAEGFVSQICSFPETTHDDYVDACVDGLTQVQMAVGTKAIKDILVGDMVMTPAGLRRVTAVHDNGYKEVWNVNGLLATAEHRVMTQEGWVRVDCLSQSVHNVYLYKDTSWLSNQKVLLSSRWSSMVASTTATLRATTRRIADTLRGLATGFTAMFGSTTTGQSLRACTSTTLMATRPTMTSATWPASQKSSIGTSTGPKRLSAAVDQSSLSTLSGFDPGQPTGTDQTRAGRGTESTPRRLWQRLGQSLGFTLKAPLTASGAAWSRFARQTESDSAAQPAKRPSPSSASVRQVTNTRTMRHVYDLTVEGEHCYYANGILVHNCTQALRYLRDAGWLEIDPPPRDDWDEDDYADTGRQRRVNPYAV
jgi:predicted phage terminase large subunit-like protein